MSLELLPSSSFPSYCLSQLSPVSTTIGDYLRTVFVWGVWQFRTLLKSLERDILQIVWVCLSILYYTDNHQCGTVPVPDDPTTTAMAYWRDVPCSPPVWGRYINFDRTVTYYYLQICEVAFGYSQCILLPPVCIAVY